MEEQVKEFKLTKREKLLIGVVGVGAVVLGYKYGVKITIARYNRGLAKLFKVDDTLSDHMIKAISEYDLQKLAGKKS